MHHKLLKALSHIIFFKGFHKILLRKISLLSLSYIWTHGGIKRSNHFSKILELVSKLEALHYNFIPQDICLPFYYFRTQARMNYQNNHATVSYYLIAKRGEYAEFTTCPFFISAHLTTLTASHCKLLGFFFQLSLTSQLICKICFSTVCNRYSLFPKCLSKHNARHKVNLKSLQNYTSYRLSLHCLK